MAGQIDDRYDVIISAVSENSLYLLPRNMRELAGLVGIPAFALLVKEYGGGAPLRIPPEANPDHRLWELLGPDIFNTLVIRYKREVVEVAKCDRIVREFQRQAIRYDYFNIGDTQDVIAKRYGFTVRHVRNILYYFNEPKPELNLSLF